MHLCSSSAPISERLSCFLAQSHASTTRIRLQQLVCSICASFCGYVKFFEYSKSGLDADIVVGIMLIH